MTIRTQTDDHVFTITLDRPEALNALDPDSMIELREQLIGFRDDPDLAVAVITGAGDRAFCAGADLKQTPPPETSFAASHLAPYEHGVRDGGYARAITLTDLRINKPLIAAINGHALGGGLEIALQCDLRIATSAATFGLPEARWASVPAVGGASLLLRALPPAIAMKLLLTGGRLDAQEALRHGLISDVVGADELLEHALSLARDIIANGPLAVRALTDLAHRTFDMPLSQSIATEQLIWGLLRDTDDRIEGRNAFAAHRAPDYQGR